MEKYQRNIANLDLGQFNFTQARNELRVKWEQSNQQAQIVQPTHLK